MTARPIGLQSIEHIAQPINILNNEEFAKRQSSSIGETLSNVPGVTTNRFSPLASRSIVHGLGGSRVLVLEAEQIEIFRGPSTLLYGSEASGGLVNIVNNRIPDYIPDFNSNVYSSYSSNSLEKLFSFRSEGGYGNIAFYLDGTKRDAKNYHAKNGQIENSFYDTQNFNFGTSYIDDWGFFGASYGRFNSTHGVPSNPKDLTELPFIETQQDQFDFSGQIINPFSGIKTISFQAGYNDYQHTEFEDATTPGTVFNNEQLDSRIEIQLAPLGIFHGIIGTQFGYRDVSAVGDEAFIPKTNTKTVAAFILEETDINDALHFEISGRYEYQVSDPDNAREVSNDLYNVSSGLHWHFIEDMVLGININRSQRAARCNGYIRNWPIGT